MVKNRLFEITEAVSKVIVAPTSYTLAESGLVCELCIAGDELNTAKVRLMIAGEDDDVKVVRDLKAAITTELSKIQGINDIVIKCRLLSDLSHCPSEIQHLF